MKQLIKYIQLLSLDVAFGGVIMSLSIAKLLGVELSVVVCLALFLCIWMIYTLDHLLDAKKVDDSPSMERHKFHQVHGALLFAVLWGTAMLSLSLLFFLPTKILLYGVITAGVISGYFLLTWWLKVFIAKEILIAILYSVGVCLAPMILQVHFSVDNFLIFIQIALIAFSNLLLFSYRDVENDLKDGYSSWSTIHGSENTERLLKTVLSVSLIIVILLSIFAFGMNLSFVFQLILTSMLLVLIGLCNWGDNIQSQFWFRLLGDGVFMLPGIILLF